MGQETWSWIVPDRLREPAKPLVPRLLPARLVVYFVLGLALFSPAPYLEVMRHLVEGLRGAGLLGDWRIPAMPSLFRARQRLGPEPLLALSPFEVANDSDGDSLGDL
ncbi:transposase domain-containing protein [Streptomyces sp. NPDC046853]|uniref:transposase domain-containing protein n=1 Tax=Streptomyces sp. NPDC046853 TaxID=3154920 RepID=UPI0033CDB96F